MGYKFKSDGMAGWKIFHNERFMLQIVNRFSIPCLPENYDEEAKKQSKLYNITVMLHPCQGMLEEPPFDNNPGWERVAADEIIRIGKYILKKKIPACFPKSAGYEPNPEQL